MMKLDPNSSTTQSVQGFRLTGRSMGLTELLMLNKEGVYYFYSHELHSWCKK